MHFHWASRSTDSTYRLQAEVKQLLPAVLLDQSGSPYSFSAVTKVVTENGKRNCEIC